MPWQHCSSSMRRYGAALLGTVSGLRVLALAVTLPAHWEQEYYPPPSSSFRFRVHRHSARLTYHLVTSLGLAFAGGMCMYSGIHGGNRVPAELRSRWPFVPTFTNLGLPDQTASATATAM